MIKFLFQALSENHTSWIPVQSIAGGNVNLELQSKNQSTVNLIFVVERALKIGVPLLFVLFTGSFFCCGLLLKEVN